MTRGLEPPLRLDEVPTPAQTAAADRRRPGNASYVFLVAGSVGALRLRICNR